MLITTRKALDQAVLDFEYKLMDTIADDNFAGMSMLRVNIYRQVQSIKALIKKA